MAWIICYSQVVAVVDTKIADLLVRMGLYFITSVKVATRSTVHVGLLRIDHQSGR